MNDKFLSNYDSFNGWFFLDEIWELRERGSAFYLELQFGKNSLYFKLHP